MGNMTTLSWQPSAIGVCTEGHCESMLDLLLVPGQLVWSHNILASCYWATCLVSHHHTKQDLWSGLQFFSGTST